MSKEIYIVRYGFGSYSDFNYVNIFATESESKAKKYRAKFNRILKKWKDYYSQFEDKDKFNWLKDDNAYYFDRWYNLKEISECSILKIEAR